MDLMGTGILRRLDHGSVYEEVRPTKEKQLTQTLTKRTQTHSSFCSAGFPSTC